MSLLPVPVLSKRPARHRSKRVTATVKPVPFWRKYAHPELDASGDWLLKNLAAMRAQSLPRAIDR